MDKIRNHRKPYIVKGLYLGLLVFLLLTAIFVLFHRHNLPLLLYLLITSLMISALTSRTYIAYYAKRQTFNYLDQFTQIPALGAYTEAMNAAYTKDKQYDHFVLLLHGFTASPHEMQHLITELESKGIPYLAPMLTGFGLTDFHLLGAARHQDFFRSALFYYDFLSKISNKVSVIGHSMGAVLATYIAQNREIHKLILTAPALYFFPEDKRMIQLLLTPVISDIFAYLVPCLPKTVRKKNGFRKTESPVENTRFQYLSIPTHAAKHMLLAKKMVDITKIKKTDLHIIYGNLDHIVNIKKCLSVIEKANLPHSTECIADTGHNLFEDNAKHKASDLVMSFLNE